MGAKIIQVMDDHEWVYFNTWWRLGIPHFKKPALGMAQDPENLESMNETNEIIYEFRHFPEMSKIVKNPIEISLQLQNYGFNELQWEPPLISQVWARASGSWIASLPSVAPPVDEVDPDCLGGGDWDNWWLVGGFKHLLFSHNIWDNPSHWLIFFRGSWNHQPGIIVNDYGLFHGLFPHSLLIKHQ